VHFEPTIMTPPAPPKITFGEMRASGVRDVLIYCRDHRCHHLKISANRWANHQAVVLSEASSAPPAASAVRTCGRHFSAGGWGRVVGGVNSKTA
jgi:hypothetical protein